MNTKELDNQYVAHAYGRFDVALTKGQGSTLYDEDGKKYIDFGSGIGVTAFGINDPVWTKAVEEQLHRVQHTSNLYYTAPCAKLAQLLCEKSGMKKVFFGNSGAEANEGAIKFARKYSFDKYGAGRSTIITLVNSFHGRTITTLAATGQDSFHTVFDPFTPGFKYCPANDIEALQAAATDDVCAVLFECVQGEGGVNNLSPTFVNAIAKLAKEKDILIAVDEVQTGNGRTGTYFAYQQYGITPDIVTTAKGLGGWTSHRRRAVWGKAARHHDPRLPRLYLWRQPGGGCRCLLHCGADRRRLPEGSTAQEREDPHGAGKSERRPEHQRYGADAGDRNGQTRRRSGQGLPGKRPADLNGKNKASSAAGAEHQRCGAGRGTGDTERSA